MRSQVRFTPVLVIGGALVTTSIGSWVQQNRSVEQDRAGIERLHRLDIETTISGKADDLAKLWDKDAVRLLADSPVEIGKAAIYATDKREQTPAKA
jgi:hypothetical protein